MFGDGGRPRPAGRPRPPAHDAFTRLLTRLEPDPDTLWTEAEPQVRRDDGILVVDDSTPDKPYATAIALVTRHGSGKHRAVVRGINLVSLLWTDGDRHIPCDYRVYDAARDGKTENDHFRDRIGTVHGRGFRPRCVAFDGWYGSLENRKAVRACGCGSPGRRGTGWRTGIGRALARLTATAISAAGMVVWRPGFGLVKVFGIVAPNGGTTDRATDDLGVTAIARRQYAEFSWAIESDHRGIEQCTGIERCQARSAKAQRNHIGLVLRAFLRFVRMLPARGQLGGGEDGHHPRRRPQVPGTTPLPTPQTGNCVTLRLCSVEITGQTVHVTKNDGYNQPIQMENIATAGRKKRRKCLPLRRLPQSRLRDLNSGPRLYESRALPLS